MGLFSFSITTEWVVLHFQQINHYPASFTIISPAQKILKPKESIHQANVSYNMLAHIFSTIFIYLHTHTHTHTYIYIYIFVYILMRIHTYMYKIHSTEQIGPKRFQLQSS